MPRKRARSHQLDDAPPVLTGWGRAHQARSTVISPGDVPDLELKVREHPGPVLARGCGSSYGDAATCSGGTVLEMTSRRELLHLDVENGIAVAEAGLTLGSLLTLTAPHGWRPPVLPGTPDVTLGGAVAANIHGKNHPDAGSFGRHVDWLVVLSGDLEPRLISPATHPDQFWATVGGLGLTGPILMVALRLAPLGTGPATTRRMRAGSLRGVMRLLDTAHEHGVEPATGSGVADVHAVAWLDGGSGGRGLVDVITLPPPSASSTTLAAPTADESAPECRQTTKVKALTPPGISRSATNRSLPSLPGIGLMTRGTIVAATAARWALPSRRLRRSRVEAALFPLRHASLWPALFGVSGLVQYQFVVPTEAGDAVAESLALLSRRRLPPALATLKRLGAGDPSPLGFARPGWTLAVDLPARWAGLPRALDALDHLVCAAGGRVYLAKDLRLDPRWLEQMYPDLDGWRRTRDEMDPDHRFGSDLSRRLNLTPSPGGSR